MTTSVVFDWMAEEGEKLATCKHDDPFGILGPQKFEDKFIVRLWMPEAEKVDLILKGEKIALNNPNHPFLFESLLENNTPIQKLYNLSTDSSIRF